MEGIRRINLLGCPFDAVSFNETVQRIERAVLEDSYLQIVPGSIDFVIKARKDAQFADLLWKSGLVIADGVPIVWAAKVLRDPIKGRVSGTDLVSECARISSKHGSPVALIGGRFAIAHQAAKMMRGKYKGAKLFPIFTPFPLTITDNQQLVEKIRAIKAKIVLVALGAPKQERWVHNNLRVSGANVGIGVGSAFDIISGDKRRAPRFLRDYGFEWFHRMMLEPRRLWRRYLVEDVPFFYFLAVEALKRRLG